MSRFWASVGAAIGVASGAAAGEYIAGMPSVRRTLLDNNAANEPYLIATSMGIGAMIGAAIGAGSEEPKQVGTSGVGMYLGKNEAFP